MGLILNIETSTPVCSVCLARDGEVIGFREIIEANAHAKLLTTMIKEIVSESEIVFDELDAMAVSEGPGSYTGLRIGVAAAKGLCYALNKPLISVPTLRALSEGVKDKSGVRGAYYMPVMDARRMDMYTAIYNTEGNEIFTTACVTINQELQKNISPFGKIYIGGNATGKCKNILTAPNIFFVEDVECDSRWMVNISENKYLKKDFENTAYFEPKYLKEFSTPARN